MNKKKKQAEKTAAKDKNEEAADEPQNLEEEEVLDQIAKRFSKLREVYGGKDGADKESSPERAKSNKKRLIVKKD